MWYRSPKDLPDWTAAEAHLRAADARLGAVVERIGPCRLVPLGRYPSDSFLTLCKALFSQQISSAVAAVLFARFRGLFPRKRPIPELVLKLTDEQLRSCGLSRQKMAYVRDLAQHFADGRIPLQDFPHMDDEAIIESLTAVHGIGRWTAEMFLMFVLVRPDVLPVDDLGIQKNMAAVLGKRHPLKKKRMIQFAEPWRPYRTVACWYLWRMTD